MCHALQYSCVQLNRISNNRHNLYYSTVEPLNWCIGSKILSKATDLHLMITLSSTIFAVLIITSVITAVSMLNIFAHSIGHETQLHDLRNHVKELQYQHALYLAQISGQIPDKRSKSKAEPRPAQPRPALTQESAPPKDASQNLSVENDTEQTESTPAAVAA